MRGEVSEEELGARYTEEAEALAEAGADGPIFETLSDVAEAMGAKSQCAAGELVDAVGLDLRRIQASGTSCQWHRRMGVVSTRGAGAGRPRDRSRAGGAAEGRARRP